MRSVGINVSALPFCNAIGLTVVWRGLLSSAHNRKRLRLAIGLLGRLGAERCIWRPRIGGPE